MEKWKGEKIKKKQKNQKKSKNAIKAAKIKRKVIHTAKKGKRKREWKIYILRFTNDLRKNVSSVEEYSKLIEIFFWIPNPNWGRPPPPLFFLFTRARLSRFLFATSTSFSILDIPPPLHRISGLPPRFLFWTFVLQSLSVSCGGDAQFFTFLALFFSFHFATLFFFLTFLNYDS